MNSGVPEAANPGEPPSAAREKGQARRAVFRRAQRLGHAREFEAVYSHRLSRARGPLVIFAKPNGLASARLGLSVGRRVGMAVTRARIKRLLRESFRLERAGLPGGLDLVINVRPHKAKGLGEYRQLLAEAWASLARAAQVPGNTGAGDRSNERRAR